MTVGWAAEAPTRAVRVDQGLGIREVVEFFGPNAERLAGSTHLPLGEVSGGVVVCSSICNDFMVNYRREVMLARAMAGQGLAVQRFHYRGTGNSDGDSSETSFETMREDALGAAEHLQAASGTDRLAFVGTRMGGLVAASAARSRPKSPLALLEPTAEGARFFRDGFRARAAHAIKEGRREAVTTEDLMRELARNGAIDVLGYSIDRLLYETASGRRLAEELSEHRGPVLLVELDGKGELRPEYRRLVSDLAEQGIEVEARSVGGRESWWFMDEQIRPEAGSLEAVVVWLSNRLGGGDR